MAESANQDNGQGCVVITGRDNIEAVRILAIRRALILEVRTGLKWSKGSILKLVRGIVGPKCPRTKAPALAALEAYMTEHRIPFNPA